MIRSWIAIAFVAAAFSICADGRSQTLTGTLEGSVLDSNKGGIPGWLVVAWATETGVVSTVRTKADGSFRFPNLVPGFYAAAIPPTGGFHGIRRGRVSVPPGGSGNVQWTLPVGVSCACIVGIEWPKNLGTVEGRVFDEKGRPVPLAAVAINGAIGYADIDGVFRYTGVVGSQTVLVSSPGFSVFGEAQFPLKFGANPGASIELKAVAGDVQPDGPADEILKNLDGCRCGNPTGFNPIDMNGKSLRVPADPRESAWAGRR